MSRMVGRARRSTRRAAGSLGGGPDAVGGGSEERALPRSLRAPWETTRSPRCFPAVLPETIHKEKRRADYTPPARWGDDHTLVPVRPAPVGALPAPLARRHARRGGPARTAGRAEGESR